MSNKLGVEHQPESHLLPAWWIFGVAIPSQKGFARHLPPGAQSRWEGFSSISGECRCMGRGTSTIESSYCWWFRCDIPNNRLGCTKPWKNNGIFTISTGERRSSEPSTLCIYNMYIYIYMYTSFSGMSPGRFVPKKLFYQTPWLKLHRMQPYSAIQMGRCSYIHSMFVLVDEIA